MDGYDSDPWSLKTVGTSVTFYNVAQMLREVVRFSED